MQLAAAVVVHAALAQAPLQQLLLRRHWMQAALATLRWEQEQAVLALLPVRTRNGEQRMQVLVQAGLALRRLAASLQRQHPALRRACSWCPTLATRTPCSSPWSELAMHDPTPQPLLQGQGQAGLAAQLARLASRLQMGRARPAAVSSPQRLCLVTVLLLLPWLATRALLLWTRT